MKRLLIGLTASGLAMLMDASLRAEESPAPEIYWVHSPKEAVAIAQELRTPILAFVTSGNCGYCRKMEQEVWTNRDIIAQVEAHFTPLRLTAELDSRLVAALGIRSFPTTVIFTQEGEIITGAAGFMPPNRLAGLLRAALRPNEELQPLPPTE